MKRDITYEELGCAIIALSKDELHNEVIDDLSLKDLRYLLFNKKGTVRFCNTGLILNPKTK